MALNYGEHGSEGPPVALLHGLGSRGKDWVLQVEALRQRYRTLAIDLPGHGGSPMLPGWPRMRDLAAPVAELLERRGASPAHLVGLSLGGAVALELAHAHPDLVRSLTIVNSSGSLGGDLRRVPTSLVRLALLLGPKRWLGTWVARGLFPKPEQAELRRLTRRRLAENSRLHYLKAVAAIVRFNLGDQVRQLRAPTMVVAGDRDRTVPLRAKRALAAAIPGAELRIVADSGHATPIDAPEQFNQMLLEFLERVERGAGPLVAEAKEGVEV